ncbi:hypothetical protein XAP412_250063 [Xanthomonas phaseoli pv. phaseoli]|uniref:Uncharacterized protein n=1 Tax=Xanthomonas campestris pv. phaseoli TaxID=317013 RepID=A0AB38E0B9_XANCH|nr:hypothetical protein XAP6984_310148 [Xanthomonas phaseoli pv. phaseoli]SON82431.1 hypothetical protein XAP412_250063 [Xanthomonas phaseoli pv. phaseoli]SON86546.1 hypothetical protein XAP7430_260146 [Xanthomonas phaseoli pv. phaseoli]SOO26968.1 hypothetical protein XAP6164_1060005 [Xanthomonas phaseoli pv. phaseoli]
MVRRRYRADARMDAALHAGAGIEVDRREAALHPGVSEGSQDKRRLTARRPGCRGAAP